MIDFGNPTWVTLVSDSGTPPHLVQYAGIRLLLPQGIALPALGAHDTLVVLGVELPGYSRTGSGGFEWVMTPAVDPVIAALNSIPGPGGWKSEAAKALYANIGGALLGQGITLTEVKTALTQLYQGAITNHLAP